mgnify:CR=1 FL=1
MPHLETANVLRHDPVGPDLYELELSAPQTASAAVPGQFVHIHVRPVWNSQQQPSASAQPCRQVQAQAQPQPSAQSFPQPLLRRPFSISGVDSQVRGSIAILYKVRGAGTALLTNVRPGDCLDVMGPLGRGFSLPEPPARSAQASHALLIGGGLGIAPLVFLARTLAQTGHRVTVFYGANTACETQSAVRGLQASCAEGSIQVFTTTLDGSAGLTGIVTDLLTAEPSAAALSDVDFIYTCGPEPMMAAVEQFATARHIPGEMSLETALACGVGACLGCARRLKADPGAGPVYARVCKDGPVFSIGQVELNPVPRGEEECKCM